MDVESKPYDELSSCDGWVELGIPSAILVLISVLVTIDLVSEFSAGVSLAHIVIEVGIVISALVAAVLLLRRLKAAVAQERDRARATIEAIRESGAAWRTQAGYWRAQHQDVLRGLSHAIEAQFIAWELTPAESEVALLLLKGLTFKEIGDARQVSERTARDQARAVYRKGGLANRGELAAFFLEDFLVLPEPAREVDQSGQTLP